MTAERLTLTNEECDEARKQAWLLVVPALKGLEDWPAFLVKHTDFERALAREGASRGLQRAAEIAREEGNCAENGVLVDCPYCCVAASIDREREGQSEENR